MYSNEAKPNSAISDVVWDNRRRNGGRCSEDRLRKESRQSAIPTAWHTLSINTTKSERLQGVLTNQLSPSLRAWDSSETGVVQFPKAEGKAQQKDASIGCWHPINDDFLLCHCFDEQDV